MDLVRYALFANDLLIPKLSFGNTAVVVDEAPGVLPSVESFAEIAGLGLMIGVVLITLDSGFRVNRLTAVVGFGKPGVVTFCAMEDPYFFSGMEDACPADKAIFASFVSAFVSTD